MPAPIGTSVLGRAQLGDFEYGAAGPTALRHIASGTAFRFGSDSAPSWAWYLVASGAAFLFGSEAASPWAWRLTGSGEVFRLSRADSAQASATTSTTGVRGILRPASGRIIERTQPWFEYEYQANIQDFGGRGCRTMILEVQTRLKDNRVGEVSRILVRNEPPDMSQVHIALAPIPGGLLVDWSTWKPPLDLEAYEIGYGEHTTFGPNAMTLIVRRSKNNTVALVDLETGTLYFVQVTPHDPFGPGRPLPVVGAVAG